MRRFALGCLALGLMACSRGGPAPDAARGPQPPPPPPVAKEDRRASGDKPATLRLATAVDEAADAGAATAGPAALPLRGRTVLHVGDSMVGGDWGLTRALQTKFDKEGAKFLRDFKVSESIVSFDKSTKLRELLTKNNPDIVILTLGTNDVFVPYPQALAPNVQNIVKRIGSRECYWIGPPLWKPDTGIVAVIRDNAAPCKFFDSSPLKLERTHDGIHPTNQGGAEWADHFWAFFRGVPATSAGAGAVEADAGLIAPP